MDQKVFDAHMHVGFWGPQSTRGRTVEPFHGREMDSPEKVLACLGKNRVVRAVLVPIYSLDNQHAYRLNSLVLETAQRAPDHRIVPGFWIDPSPALHERLEAALKMARENGVYVLKTASQTWDGDYSPDPATWDKSFRKSMDLILEHAKETHSVLQMHTGSGKSDVRAIEKFIRYAGPGITFHLVHMGHTVNGQFYLIPRLEEWLDSGLDVVCDTSWSSGFAVRWLFDLAAGSPVLREAIMFASDEPWGIFSSELAKVLDAAEGKQELLDDVLWANAARIYSQPK